jgi:prepilin-type N-terminal cleavage/methylation domain-containing protein
VQLKRAQDGFTLTELAVVFAIIGLLIGGAMMTLSAQVEQRNSDETLRRLNAAADALIAYAIVNRRLPCPATAGTTGDEAPPGGGPCTTWYGGFLPARTIGFQPVDTSGYGVDVWGNRIRYALSGVAPTGCTGGAPVTPHFTSQANLKANGVSCRPNDLDVCASSVGTTATSCNTAARVANTETVAFIVYSTGKNGATAASYGADETENADGDRVFVSRTPSGTDATAGYYDDLMVFVPAGVVYSKLIAAGLLP